MEKPEHSRKGIISAGSWLVDTVKFIDKYPVSGNLVTIDKIEIGLGGCAHNVLVDLARLSTDMPLYAGGCIGTDANRDFVMNEITRYGIDSRYMYRLEHVPTSYTDVMSETGGNASRTFFHFRGANACLGREHLSPINVPARIFHLGYLLLLDELDKKDSEYGIKAARVLHELQKKGYETSVDVVSEESDRFREIMLPCLPYIDYLIINEVEAGACCHTQLRDEKGKISLESVKSTVGQLLALGVNKVCAVHFPEGGYAARKQGETCYIPSIPVDKKDIISPVGAGDAFCAGMLYALHENQSLRDAVIFANTSARFNLRSATSTGGAPCLSELEHFIHLNYTNHEKK